MTAPRRLLGLAALLALLLPAVALWSPAASMANWGNAAIGSKHTKTSLSSIEDEVMCVTCKIPLQVARSEQSNREREYIQSLVDKNLTKGQIKKDLVAQYGPAVLGSPPASGFNLTVYIIPIAVVLGLIALVAALLPAWRRHARAHGGRLPMPERLDKSDTARLDADLARFD